MNHLFTNKSKIVQDSPSGRSWNLPQRSYSMRMKWHDLLFLNWPISVDAISRLIPDRLEVDTFDGSAWISVVPFTMSGVSLRWVPDVPFMSRFPELNVRTYVKIDNKPGVWFFTLDATNPIAVRVARSWFHLNYVDSRIDVTQSGNWIRYRSRRVDRNSPAAELSVDYRPLGETFFSQPGSLDHWLTSRYCLYVQDQHGRILRGDIDHAPWQLRETQAVIHTNTMLESLGLAVDGEPFSMRFAKRTDVHAWSLDEVT